MKNVWQHSLQKLRNKINTKLYIRKNVKGSQMKERTKSYSVHESSYIDKGVEIGEGTKIWHTSHILRGSKVGENCIIGQNVVIGPDVTIGSMCKI